MDFEKVAQLHREGHHDSGINAFAAICAMALYEKHRLPEDVTHLVHYTTVEALMSILGVDGTSERAAELAIDGSPNTVDGVSGGPYLRLYDTNYSNDPNEGYHFVSLAGGKGERWEKYKAVWRLFEERSNYPGYITSFVCVSDLEEVDDLVFWRTYGKEGRGCALALPVSCFGGESNLFRVRYGEPAVTESLEKLSELLEQYASIEGSVRIRDIANTRDLPRPLQKVLSPLVYLCKSEAYRYEKEARMVIPFSDLEGNLYLQGSQRGEPSVVWRHFAEVPSLGIQRLFVTDAVVVLGPTVEFAANVQFVLERLFLQRSLYGPKVERSSISYRH